MVVSVIDIELVFEKLVVVGKENELVLVLNKSVTSIDVDAALVVVSSFNKLFVELNTVLRGNEEVLELDVVPKIKGFVVVNIILKLLVVLNMEEDEVVIFKSKADDVIGVIVELNNVVSIDIRVVELGIVEEVGVILNVILVVVDELDIGIEPVVVLGDVESNVMLSLLKIVDFVVVVVVET
jgi:hypothetical protein